MSLDRKELSEIIIERSEFEPEFTLRRSSAKKSRPSWYKTYAKALLQCRTTLGLASIRNTYNVISLNPILAFDLLCESEYRIGQDPKRRAAL